MIKLLLAAVGIAVVASLKASYNQRLLLAVGAVVVLIFLRFGKKKEY